MVIPVVLMFFFCGVYVGSQFMADGAVTAADGAATTDITASKGLPGTKNIVRRWTDGGGSVRKYLRGAAAEIADVARRAEQLVGLAPPAPLTHTLHLSSASSGAGTGRAESSPDGAMSKDGGSDHALLAPVGPDGAPPKKEEEEVLRGLQPPLMPNSVYNHPPVEKQHLTDFAAAVVAAAAAVVGPKGHVVSGSELTAVLKNSFHATSLSSVKAATTLDSESVLAGAWVYLDEGDALDKDMRTIFSNKRAGCGTQADRNGFSMYVNAWQTHDHRLYVEYGGGQSGCNKLDSSGVELHPHHWYHVALYLGPDTAALYIDGSLVSGGLAAGALPSHNVQRERPMWVGQYDGAQYPLYGNVSHLAVVHCGADWTAATIDNAVKTMMDVHLITTIKGLHALYTLEDVVHEVSKGVAKESINSLHGVYNFPAPTLKGKTVEGVGIPLVDGVGGRPVTEEMRTLSDKEGRTRREKIKEGMKHAWDGYKTYAWGRDEVLPISNRGQDNWGGMGVTLVDSLDTLWIMGMKTEFEEAKEWVRTQLSFNHADTVSVFETTIRELGGLLAAYDLSGDKVFLDKARVLGDLLMPAFDTATGIPTAQVSFHSHAGVSGWAGNTAILAELGTLQVEFRHLAHHTRTPRFEDKAMRPLQLMRHRSSSAWNGLYPIKVDIQSGAFADSQITFGALGDSFYEYLLKVWIQGGKKEAWLREMYDTAMDGVVGHLLQASAPSGLAFLADWNGNSVVRKMDHLVCFMPGALALGAHTDPRGKDSPRAKRDLAVAKALMYTCYQMYARMRSGISAEYVEFPATATNDFVVTSAPFYILRPETAESLFVLGQLTGDPIYRDWAWEIYQSIDKHCRTPTAYGALRQVQDPAAGVDDRMESFFLAETMKYLYLAQDPDHSIDLDKYVINTEAHPTKILSGHTAVKER